MSATIMPDEHDLDDQYGPYDEPAVADTGSEEWVVLTSILATATHAPLLADNHRSSHSHSGDARLRRTVCFFEEVVT